MLGVKTSALVCTWLACDILLDLLWRPAGSPSRILSMLQPQESMVFRDSLTGQLYPSFSCAESKTQRQSRTVGEPQRHIRLCKQLTTLSHSALYGFNRW